MDKRTTLGELIPCGGGDPIPLLKPKLLVGRRSNCDIALGYQNVSSQHCQLELINGYWNIRDLNSRNGIKVNGVRCDSKWLLPGDELSIARHRYEVVYHPDTDEPPPEDEDPFAVGLLEKAGLARRDAQERRKRSLPPAVRPVDTQAGAANGSDQDDQVLGWLNDDGDD
jgi:predicted component of type VI protein secretion system